MTAVLEQPEVTVADIDHPSCAAGAHRHQVVDKQGRPIAGLLCERHFTDLGRILRDIEGESAPYQTTESGERVRNLDPLPSMQTRLDSGGGGLASELSPVRANAVVHRDHRMGTGDWEDEDDARAAGSAWPVLVILHRWAEHVRREGHLTRPVSTVRLGWVHARRGPVCGRPCGHDSCGMWITDTVRAEPTIRSERELLTRQLDWIARQDWVGTMYRDLRVLRDQLRRANGTQVDEPLPGRCPALVDGRDCGGPLWPVKPKHTVGEWTGASASAIACAACRTRWEGPSELARLALILDQQGRKS